MLFPCVLALSSCEKNKGIPDQRQALQINSAWAGKKPYYANSNTLKVQGAFTRGNWTIDPRHGCDFPNT